jgi:HSP20 family protein
MSLTTFRIPLSTIDNDWFLSDPFRDAFFGSQVSMPKQNPAQAFSPLLTSDVVESNDKFQVLADLPGVEPADLDISIDGRSLVMKAERKHVHETNTDKVHRLERSYGTVERRIQLPKNADLEHAETQFKNGVLTVSFPKLAALPASGPRKLTINSA